MAKDYFQDIVPPHEDDDAEDVGLSKRENRELRPTSPLPPPPSGDRSIRNININRRSHPMPPAPPTRPGKKSKSWVWILAVCSVAVLGLFAFLFAFKQTTVAIVPHSQTVAFDDSSQFTAYPSSTAASGTILYTVKTVSFDDSQEVAASGTAHKETKATGSIVVSNDFSTDPVKLLKNTRFSTASGLIFRTPVEVVVPGKKGTAPGTITITVTADKVGSEYNIAAGQKLTLPGLQSTPAMFNAVYATTAAPTVGGFSGDAPSVDAATLSSANSTIKSSLDQKVQTFLSSLNTDSDLALKPVVVYSEQPTALTEGGKARVGMKAQVSVPVIIRSHLSAAIAQAVTADSSNQAYILKPSQDFAVNVVEAGDIGTDPVTFTLTGTGLLVAEVDTKSLITALAGRDQSAFKTIVANFPGVDSANARIEPFWNDNFPSNPEQIRVTVESAPKAE